MSLDKMLTVEETAKLLGVPKSQIYYAITTRKIAFEQKGRAGKFIQRSDAFQYKRDRAKRQRRLARQKQ